LNTSSRLTQPALQKAHRLAVIETTLAIAFWGLSFVTIKVALQEISPVTLIVLRFMIGSMILSAVSLFRGDLAHLRRNDLPSMALLGLVGVSLQQMLQVSGQVSADAGAAAFLASTAPAFIVLFGALFLREKLRLWQVIGVLLATLGAGVVSSGGDIEFLLNGHFGSSGSLLVLLSSVAWAAFSILNRYFVKDRPPALLAAGMMTFGWLFLLPLFVAQGGWQEFSRISVTGWVAVGLTGVLSTAVAYLLYAHALKLAPASRLAAIQTIEPIIAIIAAGLVLAEAVTLPLAAGGVAILSGVYLAERHPAGRTERSSASQTPLKGV
jgi:drug/metabolite transporter (DMT)-like permease